MIIDSIFVSCYREKKMNNLLTEILNIDLPIIQAPMAGVQDADLAVSVCNAGGLGSLPTAMMNFEQLETELNKLEAINKPYNVNFFCHTPPKLDDEREQGWRERLNSYYQEYDIDSSSIKTGAARDPFSPQSAQLLARYKPAVVSFHFGLPSKELVEQVKSWGSKVICSATTVEEAIWLEQNDVDMIIAQGVEAGGHRGMFLSDDLTTQVGTLSLLPQIIAAVSMPVIAAGGIANAKTVKAMIDMGASGVQVGTAYLLCDEAKTSAIHRAALKSNNAKHTALTNIFSGRPARGIVNRIIREVGPISDSAPAFPLAGGAISKIRAKAEQQRKGDFTPLWSGQNNSGCKEISATELTKELAALIHH